MVYDCFTFFNELDLLEIRLNILDPYVDMFVLGQSSETFSGIDKPYYFHLGDERWSKWKHKIREVIIPKQGCANAFERAAFQKDYLRNGLLAAFPEDIVYFGDLDEIWAPASSDSFHFEIGADNKVYNLKQLNYSYYLNNRSSEEWIGTIMGKWKTIKKNSFNYWRAHHNNVRLAGGWHFTNMGGPDQIRKKLEAYDHQEYNTDEVKDNIETRARFGMDYVGREQDWQGKPFEFCIDEVDLPQYLLDNKDKWKKLFLS